MAAPVFLCPAGDLVVGDVVVTGDEGRHAVAVSRLRVGESVELVDGSGARGLGVVVSSDKPDRLGVRVSDVVREAEPQLRLTVVQALTKGDRGERATEAMTEVGVDRLVPWNASRCVTRWKDDKARSKWIAHARESTKQSRRARIMAVAPLASTTEVVELLRTATVPLVLHEGGGRALAAIDLPPAGDVVLVIGPEGGIAPEELEAFQSAGATIARMGPSVMRTSTAGAVAAGVVLSRTVRWQDGAL